MGKAKMILSRMETVSSFRKPSITRWSSTCSINEEFLPIRPKSALRKLNCKIQQINASRKKKKQQQVQNYVTFSKNYQNSKVRFVCYEEHEKLSFSKGVSTKLPKITEDFDVDSDDELIGKAIESGVKSFMKMFESQK